MAETTGSLRDAFGSALVELGAKYDDFVVVDADNAPATRSSSFAERYPERFLNVGCAEQNMIGVAAGIALTGVPVIVSTFAIFLCGRAFEQIRNTICRNRLPIVLVGTHAGITVGRDGSSHFAVEDVALMRAIPGMQVLVLSCADQALLMLEAALLERSPVYVRVSRSGSAATSEGRVRLGGGERRMRGTDISFFTCGVVLDRVSAAAEMLAAQGYSVDLIDLYSVKPLDESLVIDSLNRTRAAVVIEEHNTVGGLGEAVMALSATHHPTPFSHICIRETFGRSGGPAELLDLYGVTPVRIAEEAIRVISRKVR